MNKTYKYLKNKPTDKNIIWFDYRCNSFFSVLAISPILCTILFNYRHYGIFSVLAIFRYQQVVLRIFRSEHQLRELGLNCTITSR